MAHQTGAYLGAVRCLETLRQRCVVDDDARGCWHLRSPRGRPLPTTRGARHTVFVHGLGPITCTRAAWLFSTGEMPPDGHIVWRKCDSYDCVNPAHLRCSTRGDWGRKMGKLGRWRGQWARIQANRSTAAKRRALTPEQEQLVMNSPLSSAELARQLGVNPARVADLRRGARRLRSVAACSSVWTFEG